MPQLEVEKNESFLNKIINKLKNTAIYRVLVDTNAGRIKDSDYSQGEIDEMLNGTASPKELNDIKNAFKIANEDLKRAEKQVSSVPSKDAVSPDPFAVDPDDLVKPVKSSGQNTNDRDGRDRD